MMLGTFADLLDAVAKLPKEEWSSIGTGVALCVLTGLGTVATRKGAQDRASQPPLAPPMAPTPAGGLTFLADGQTEKEILEVVTRVHEVLVDIRDNQESYHKEDAARLLAAERRVLENENHDLKDRIDTLRAGQQQTHGTQSDMIDGITETRSSVKALEAQINALMERLKLQ